MVNVAETVRHPTVVQRDAAIVIGAVGKRFGDRPFGDGPCWKTDSCRGALPSARSSPPM